MLPARLCLMALLPFLLLAGPLLAQKPKDDKDSAKKAEKAYLFVDIDQLRRYPENFKGKDVRVSDRFGEVTDLYPRTLQRKGFTSDKYLEFTTSSAIGSNMRCYLDKNNKESLNTVTGLTQNAPITLEGTVYGVVNTMEIFIADKVYSGFEIPREAGKPQITMIMEWEGDAKKYKYVISKPGQFVLVDPTTNKKINVEFQY